MGHLLTNSPLLVGDELGYRLAGFADGEGHFGIHSDPRKGTCHCVFVIGMRADDRHFLELLAQSTGVGRLFDKRASARDLLRRPGTKPQVHWVVAKKSECVVLAELFDLYPPLSKKAWDYAIWREAVAAWQRVDQPRMAELRRVLMEGRAYTESARAHIANPQLEIEGVA